MPITVSDIRANIISGTVANYSALPVASTVTGQYYNVLLSEGSRWTFSYKPKGIYYSDGATWDYRGEFPSNANQATVDAGTNDTEFLTPYTFTNSAQLAGKEPVITAGMTTEYWRGDKTWYDLALGIAEAIELSPTTAPDSGEYTCATDGAGVLRKHKWTDIFTFLVTDQNIGNFIHSLTAKPTPIDADEVGFVDTEDSNKEKKATWLQIWTNYFKGKADVLYQPLDSDLTSWASVTRASGFDTFVATPNSANLASLLTDEGTAFNKNFGTAAGTVLEGNSGAFVLSVIKQNTIITHTGSTSETKIFSQKISAGVFSANDILNWYIRLNAKSGSANKLFKVYFNTSDAIGGTQVATYTITTAALPFERTMIFKNSLSSQNISVGTSGYSNEYSQALNNAQYSTTSINFAVDQWFVVTCQLTTGTDEAEILGIKSSIFR